MEEKEDDEEKEKAEYFYRMICLVVDLGTEVLLKLFLKDIPQGQTVEVFLNSKANVLNILKNKKVFNDLQIGILNAASPDVSRFDISLLYILISNLTNIQSPNAGWFNACPIPSDKSAGALLMNLRRIRNEVIAHTPKGKMKKSDFEKYWNEAKDILIELAGEVAQAEKESVTEEIDKTKVKQLVSDKDKKLEVFFLWARQDQNCEILSSFEEVNKKNDQQSKVLEDIKSNVKTNTDQLKTLTDQIRPIPGTSSRSENDQQSKVLEDIKSNIQTNTDQLKTITDQIRQIPGTSSGTENDQQSNVLEDIKSNIQTNTDQLKTLTDQIRQIPGTSSGTENDQQSKVLENLKSSVKTNTDQLKTLTDQIRQIPGTSSGTESGAKRVKNSPEDNGNFAPDLEDSKYFIAKTKLRTDLMDHYKETGCGTTAVPALMDGEEVHIDKIFVMPSMRVRKNVATSTTGSITTIHELFQKDGQPIRRVCISGDAGQGKTTLCQKIVSTWCKVHSNIEDEPDTDYQFLKSFDLLFYLPLRNNNLSDVIKMIETDIVRETLHNDLKEFLKKESEKCLIILDGLDEWLPEDCKVKLPCIDKREKFTVLITSRPWKLDVLRPKTSEIGQEVELNGIEKDKLIEAVVDVLNNKYAKKRNWKHFRYIADNEFDTIFYLPENETYRKVKHLAEVPIILTQMVCMWYDNEEFGNTRVEIYIKMVDYLFHVADTRNQETCDSAWMRPQKSTNTQLVNVFKDFEYCGMYSEILFKLSDLAYHTLFNEERENSLVFPHSVTKKCEFEENDVKTCLFVGILSQTKRPCEASSHTTIISFLHKTFQEFLAALYIAYGGKDESFNETLDTLKSLDDVFEMSQVLIFLSGLRPDLIGDMSRHIAQLTDKDERVLQYRNSIWDKHKQIIFRLQDIIYKCIVEVPEHRMLDTKVEWRDVFLFRDDVKKMIPYLNLENVKSFYQDGDVPSKDWTKLNDLVKLCIRIESQEDIEHAPRTVERCASSLTCLSFNFTNLKDGILVNIDNILTALKKVSHLTCVELDMVKLTHSDKEYLGTTLSRSTQLKEIGLSFISCRTCQGGPCNYRIDLSHHKQLHFLSIKYLDGDIVLSNENPVECCYMHSVKCDASILDTFKSSSNLHELDVNKSSLKHSLLSHNSIITSSTTTIQDDEREVHTTPLRLSKILTDVIPTLKNLRTLHLWYIDFKQDILRLSPEMTSLENVNIYISTMTLQCLQGFIDSLPQKQFDVLVQFVYICPRKDTSTALKYITDRPQITTRRKPSDMTEDGCLRLCFTNRPSH